MTLPAHLTTDTLATSAGELQLTFLGHASLLFTWQGRSIYFDPFSAVADYASLPGASAVLVTHEHSDHFDPSALARLCAEQTEVILTEACVRQGGRGRVMKNGDRGTVLGIPVEAVPAYNLAHTRPNGEPFHPPGRGNGYVLTFGDQRVYVAGDTENIPEMRRLTGLACAFLPMNVPYTMTPAMVAEAAQACRPRFLYPYHYSDTDLTRLTALLADEKDIEVRLRSLA